MIENKNFLSAYPGPEQLKAWNAGKEANIKLKVNNHIHTPYSFSAFSHVAQAVTLAAKEGVNVLGINDFYVRDGYEEFATECRKHRVFPLFNIEFIGLSKTDQSAGIRVNDPGNPGRTYISGKGLDFPASISPGNRDKLEAMIRESQLQVEAMTVKLNSHINQCGYDISVTMDELRSRHAKKLVRERHIAKALRIKAAETFGTKREQVDFFTRIFNDTPPQNDLQDTSAFENEIRSRLLKAGGEAFVPEDEKAFLEIGEVRELILDMGGIPTYPLLLDDKNGGFTNFESPKEVLAETLLERGFRSIELIPHRNSLKYLREYVEFFYQQGFIVSYGTEHNTPELTPLTVKCRGNAVLDRNTAQIGNRGAAVVAADQYRRARGETGFLDANGNSEPAKRSELEQLGEAVIRYYLEADRLKPGTSNE